MRKFNAMILNPKKLRPPQMWWVIEQQARRRRAGLSEEPAPATAEWQPHESVATWHDLDWVEHEGDWNEFAAFDPALVQTLSWYYTPITSVSGLENLTSLTNLDLQYTAGPFHVPALPAVLTLLDAGYSGIASLPDLTTTPDLTYLNLYYSPYLETEHQAKLAMLQQLDANGKHDGYVNISNFNTGTPGANTVIASLVGKGWEVRV